MVKVTPKYLNADTSSRGVLLRMSAGRDGVKARDLPVMIMYLHFGGLIDSRREDNHEDMSARSDRTESKFEVGQ